MLRMTVYGISIAGLLLTFASAAFAQDTPDVQTRLNELEKKQDEMFNQLESEQRKVQISFYLKDVPDVDHPGKARILRSEYLEFKLDGSKSK